MGTRLERLTVREEACDISSNEQGVDASRQEVLDQDPLGRPAFSGGPRRLGGCRGTRRVDLCGLDYGDRRRRLFSALRALDPGEQIEVISDQADDVLWLRYEVEARIAERYFWSLPDEGGETARITVRRLRPSAGLVQSLAADRA